MAGCSGSKDEDKPSPTKKTVVAEQVTASMSPMSVLGADSQFSTFVELVKIAGLEEAIDNSAGLTLFVPSNKSFEELGPERLEALKSDPKGALTRTLNRHMAEGESHFADFLDKDGGVITTLTGDQVGISSANGEVHIGGAKITKSDIEAKRTVIFLVNALVEPLPEDG